MCHVLFLLPILGLPLFFMFPWELALPLYAGVCFVSAAFYWLLWRTVRRPATTGIDGMVGGVGTVFDCGEGKTKVSYRGEIWDAVSKQAISPGEPVEILGIEGLKLVIRRKARSVLVG